MKKPIFHIGLAFVLAAIISPDAIAKKAADGTHLKLVDCTSESLQAAIDAQTRPATFRFSGTCTEDITVSMDDITLDGDVDNNCGPFGNGVDGIIDGTLTVDAARRVTLNCIKAENSGSGVIVTNGSSVIVVNSDLSNNDEEGIDIRNASTAEISHSRFNENGDPTSDAGLGDGVAVSRSSHATITHSTIQGNLFTGLSAYWNADAVLTHNTITGNGETLDGCGIDSNRESSVTLLGGNVINGGTENNAFAAVCLERHASFRSGSYSPGGDPLPGEVADQILQGSAVDALSVGELGYADFRNTVVIGNVEVAAKSVLRVQSSTFIDGDLSVYEDSMFRFRNAGLVPAQLKNGNLTCDGTSGIYFSSVIPCNVMCDGDGICSPLP